MNKTNITLSLIFIIIICGGLYMFCEQKSDPKRYLENHIKPIIVTVAKDNWSKKSFDEFASPSLKSWFEENDYNIILSTIKKLGKFNKYTNIQEYIYNGSVISSVSLINFETGDAQVLIKLAKYKDKWLIDSFNIISPLLTGESENNVEKDAMENESGENSTELQ